MNLNNRRLREIQSEKYFFKQCLDKCETISDCLAYQGKIDILEKEEKIILKENGVDIQ